MDTGDYFKFVLALVFVLGLIGVLALLVRRYGFGMSALQKSGGIRRLQVVEVTPIDARRRLVLVRRDAVEHLILLGATGETIIELNIQKRNIQSGGSATNDSTLTESPGDLTR